MFPSHLITLSFPQALRKSAIRDMPAVPGWKRCKVPKKKMINRSILYDFGVRFEEDGTINPDPRKQLFFCMGNPACRKKSLRGDAATAIKISKDATRNATRHIREAHGEYISVNIGALSRGLFAADILKDPAPGAADDGICYRAFVVFEILKYYIFEILETSFL